jgi:predicted dehydrogenase
MSLEELRFAVVGCGSIGKRHIGNLHALGIRDVIGVDTVEVRRQEVERTLGISALSSLEDCWAWKPDVAVIAVPTSLHVPIAVQAAQYGCHLFVEKPLSNRLDTVSALLKLVEEKRLTTLVGCNMRFHPGLMRVKTLVENGAVGRVISARVEVGQYLPDWHPSEDYRQGYSAQAALGGGVILDAIHEIDYARWILGDVSSVACFAAKLSDLEIDTEDTAAILLRFASGAIGEIHLDYVQRAYSRTCHLIGDAGTVRWDYTAGDVLWYSARTRTWETLRNPIGWQPNQMYLDEMCHFLRCLSGLERSTLDVFEAARVLEVAIAAKTSAREQRFVDLKAGAL